MQYTFDTKKWKFDPKLWAALLALLGFANLGDLLSWARGQFFNYKGAAVAELEKKVDIESAARKTADSLILVKVEDLANSQVRVEKGVDQVLDRVLQIPQVRAYDKTKAREDSIRQERERFKRRYYDREARGGGSVERYLR